MDIRSFHFSHFAVPLSFLLSTFAQAQDFVTNPRGLCDFMASSGMTAQVQWGQRADYPSFCQHAEQFSGSSTFVRGGRAFVDATKKEVSLALSVQALGGNHVRVEVRDKLKAFVADLYRAQNKAVPARVNEILDKEITAEQTIGNERVSYSTEHWDRHKVIGISITAPAAAALLASASAGQSESDKASVVGLQKKLGDRCVKAIEQSGHTANTAQLKQSAKQLSAGRFAFEYAQNDGKFACTACDDTDPNGSCGTIGVILSFVPSQGEAKKLPAEFDRKCIDSLQRRLKDQSDKKFIDYELVKRITLTEQHTDTRWAYFMNVDGGEYRCVIRKTDWNYSLDRKRGGDWDGIVGGKMF